MDRKLLRTYAMVTVGIVMFGWIATNIGLGIANSNPIEKRLNELHDQLVPVETSIQVQSTAFDVAIKEAETAKDEINKLLDSRTKIQNEINSLTTTPTPRKEVGLISAIVDRAKLVNSGTEKPSTAPILTKVKTGEELNKKIEYFQEQAYSKDYSEEQVKWMVALIDHESAGSWDENIIGDSGKSRGIAQWNKYAGRIAGKTYEDQVEQFLNEFKPYVDKFDIKVAVGKWNAPAWDSNPAYIAKVKNSMINFI